MAEEKIPAIQITTPIGLAKFPHLINVDPHPDFGGDYGVKLLLETDSNECKQLIAQLEAARDTFRPLMEKREKIKDLTKEQYNWPVSEELDKEGNLTGMTEFACKSKGQFKRPDGTMVDRPHPLIYDAQQPPQKIEDAETVIGPKVPYNSRIRLCWSVVPYYAKNRAFGYGITLYIKSTQIIELAQNGASAEECGFDGVDGGYAPAPATTPVPADCPF
jgi:hypothetical protein